MRQTYDISFSVASLGQNFSLIPSQIQYGIKLARKISTKNADKATKKKNNTPMIGIRNLLLINRTQY